MLAPEDRTDIPAAARAAAGCRARTCRRAPCPSRPSRSLRLLMLDDTHAQLAQVLVEAVHDGRLQACEELDDPLLVLLGHGLEALAPERCQPHDDGTAIALADLALHETLALQLVGESRYVAARHHEIAREVAHPEPAVTVELREVVEARERDVE